MGRKQNKKSCWWSAEQGKLIHPCPPSRLRIWSREAVSAVLSRVNLLISILVRLNLILTYRIPFEFRGGVHLLIKTAILSFSGIYICYRSFLFVFFVLLCILYFCSRWSFVDVPLIYCCPADHVPDWQPRILLGMLRSARLM